MKKNKVAYDLEIFGTDIYLKSETYIGNNPVPKKAGFIWDSEAMQILPIDEWERKKKTERRKSKIEKIKGKLK